MLKTIRLEAPELTQWLAEKTIIYASNGNKRLECTLNGILIVKRKGEIVWQGLLPNDAVNEFNKL